jgi:hypothetical protein
VRGLLEQPGQTLDRRPERYHSGYHWYCTAARFSSAICVYFEYMFLAKEIYKSNFRQYGQMKSRGGKSRRREEKKKEDQKRESLRRKKIQVREKVGKSGNTVFFQ